MEMPCDSSEKAYENSFMLYLNGLARAKPKPYGATSINQGSEVHGSREVAVDPSY